jgi:hypothetical protein
MCFFLRGTVWTLRAQNSGRRRGKQRGSGEGTESFASQAVWMRSTLASFLSDCPRLYMPPSARIDEVWKETDAGRAEGWELAKPGV